MIYILSGNDSTNKTSYIKSLMKGHQRIDLHADDKSREVLLELASTVSLFGDLSIVFVESLIGEGEVVLDAHDLTLLNESPTIFVFLEDKLLKKDETYYRKYAKIENFEEKPVIKKKSQFDIFAITEFYGRKDKIGAWVIYREAIDKGVEPEAISGILFWKIKTMILNNTKAFSIGELKSQSSRIVSLYHRAHRGECDFVIGLEQFILSSLSR